MQIDKFRKVRILEIKSWKSMSDTWGEPTIMFHQLLRDEPLNIGDRIILDLRLLIERKSESDK
jgi:hypothetical protein